MISVRSKVREIPASRMNRSSRQRVLAVDYGRERIGLALSDELRLTARPLTTITRINRESDIRRLREICRSQEVAQIVVGRPVLLSGEASPMADEAARFAARIQKELGIPVYLQDERLTSWEAAEMMKEMAAEAKSSSKRAGQPLDDVAASIILREYLDRKRNAPNGAHEE